MKAATIISENKDQIISQWLKLVRKGIPDAQLHELPVLKNNIPELLDALIEMLRSNDARSLVFNSGTHGEERAKETSFTLQQIIKEYRLLKQVIFKVIDEHKDEIVPRERDGIMYAIDQAVEQASGSFFEERNRLSAEGLEKADKLTQDLQEQGIFRDRFVATISHDLRGPLNNTISATELLKNHLLPIDQDYITKLLKVIEISTLRANTLINNLLDTNLIQSGQTLPLKLEESDLHEKLQEMLRGYAPATQQRIQLKCDTETVVGKWDADALSRAVDNLITNALKHGIPDGEIVISLKQDEQNIYISVHNHGDVIPQEKIESLFTPYYRLDEARSKGWGLGLTLVKGIVQAHNGNVDVSSNPKDGTTFNIQVPNQ